MTSKPKKKKFQLSEHQLGYIMVAPALIIIFVIALFPIAKSFWYSLFDLRLNNPTRNSTYTSSKLNLETYFSNYDSAVGLMGSAAQDGSSSDKIIFRKYSNILQNDNSKLLKQSDIASKENKVREFTDKGLNVTNDNLKYSNIDKNLAEAVHNDYISLISDLNKYNGNKNVKNDTKQASEVMDSMKDSIITSNYVGFSNYSYYLNINNKDFWGSLGYTFFLTIVSVFIEFVIGMIIAIIINREFVGRGIVRASVLIPWAIPTVVSALMWKFLYDGQNGFIAHVFTSLHLIKNSGVLLTTHAGSTFAIIFADVWKTSPYMALLVLAGLQSIDNSLYEAADVDGASKLREFFKITLPILKPTILVALLFRTLDAFRIFDLVFVLTGGANQTETISTFAYKTMFAQMEFGKGSTLSVLIFICVALISIAYIKILGADVLTGEK